MMPIHSEEQYTELTGKTKTNKRENLADPAPGEICRLQSVRATNFREYDREATARQPLRAPPYRPHRAGHHVPQQSQVCCAALCSAFAQWRDLVINHKQQVKVHKMCTRRLKTSPFSFHIYNSVFLYAFLHLCSHLSFAIQISICFIHSL